MLIGAGMPIDMVNHPDLLLLLLLLEHIIMKPRELILSLLLPLDILDITTDTRPIHLDIPIKLLP